MPDNPPREFTLTQFYIEVQQACRLQKLTGSKPSPAPVTVNRYVLQKPGFVIAKAVESGGKVTLARLKDSQGVETIVTVVQCGTCVQPQQSIVHVQCGYFGGIDKFVFRPSVSNGW